MSDKAKRVLAVWVSLTDAERAAAVGLINEFQNADKARRDQIALEHLNESRTVQKATTMNFGPLQGGCPYCGR
ncbi:hypothetical protein GO290_02735 [Ralstonia solanacearum]|nr:hypothetical protein [Ralstonia solanacearum]